MKIQHLIFLQIYILLEMFSKNTVKSTFNYILCYACKTSIINFLGKETKTRKENWNRNVMAPEFL